MAQGCADTENVLPYLLYQFDLIWSECSQTFVRIVIITAILGRDPTRRHPRPAQRPRPSRARTWPLSFITKNFYKTKFLCDKTYPCNLPSARSVANRNGDTYV